METTETTNSFNDPLRITCLSFRFVHLYLTSGILSIDNCDFNRYT